MDEPPGMEGKHQVLANRDISSLVIYRLCDRARGRNVALAYFAFAAEEGHSWASIWGALLKQPLGGLDGTPGKIALTIEDRRKVIGGRGL